MADLEWTGPVERASLRRALRLALRRAQPELQVLAEDFLAETSRIDLLGLGEDGELVSVRVSSPSPKGSPDELGAEILAQGLSDLHWLTPRIADLRTLAPDLGLNLHARPRVQLVAPAFGPEIVSAAAWACAEAGGNRLSLFRYRAARRQGQLALLLDAVGPARVPDARASITTEPAPSESAAAALTAPPRTAPTSVGAPAQPRPARAPRSSAFRTGLSDADLLAEPAAHAD